MCAAFLPTPYEAFAASGALSGWSVWRHRDLDRVTAVDPVAASERVDAVRHPVDRDLMGDHRLVGEAALFENPQCQGIMLDAGSGDTGKKRALAHEIAIGAERDLTAVGRVADLAERATWTQVRDTFRDRLGDSGRADHDIGADPL